MYYHISFEVTCKMVCRVTHIYIYTYTYTYIYTNILYLEALFKSAATRLLVDFLERSGYFESIV